MKKIRILFFCGERSPWGFAHIEPFLLEKRFEIVGLVLASEKRWRIFHQKLSGIDQADNILSNKLKNILRNLFRRSLFLAKMVRRPALANTQITQRLFRKLKIPVIFCDDVNSSKSIELFKKFQAEQFLSVAYPQIFHRNFLHAFPFGVFNSHPSLLPKCRGAHPVFWAIASGEKESGASIHFMTCQLDQGDVVSQVYVELEPNDTHSQLYAKLNLTIPKLLSQFADFLMAKDLKARPQDNTTATSFKNDRQIHHRIFWTEMNAFQILNLVRACDGTAYFWHDKRKFLLRKVATKETNRNMTNNIIAPPGTVVDIQNGVPIILARSGFVELLEFESNRLFGSSFSIGQIVS